MNRAGATLTVVVPCYNEVDRLRPDEFRALADVDGVTVLFVDDGSTDGTAAVLTGLCEDEPNFMVLTLPVNVGKAEAVRAGMMAAGEGGAELVGYLDADLSTSVDEFLRLADLLSSRDEIALVMGARVALLGRRIERSRWRHFQGRIFATLVSLLLQLPVYDTQCGAKVARWSPELRAAVAEPFLTKWTFDVELLARLIEGREAANKEGIGAILEEPLREWIDVDGSHMSFFDRLGALADLARLLRRSWQWRRARGELGRLGGR